MTHAPAGENPKERGATVRVTPHTLTFFEKATFVGTVQSRDGPSLDLLIMIGREPCVLQVESVDIQESVQPGDLVAILIYPAGKARVRVAKAAPSKVRGVRKDRPAGEGKKTHG